MKDLHDVLSLGREFTFDSASLAGAINGLSPGERHNWQQKCRSCFTPKFFDDRDKKKQWAAFCNKNRNYVPEMSLESVCKEIAAFLMPILDRLNGKAASPRK